MEDDGIFNKKILKENPNYVSYTTLVIVSSAGCMLILAFLLTIYKLSYVIYFLEQGFFSLFHCYLYTLQSLIFTLIM